MAAPTEVYFKLPPYTRPITTTKPEAQTWCEYGLTWSYSFNHAESTWCFEKAIAIDPECAMAHWGLAYSIGPNYNKPWNNFDDGDLEKTLQRSHEAVRKAKSLAPAATAVEQGLINALQYRYRNDQGPKDALASWNLAYARAMKTVHDDFPDDLDVAALYADALMNLTPWALWDLRTGEPGPGSQALEVQRVLERALAQDGGHDHAGLLHFYVHLTEMSTEPERALVAADDLRRIAADAGHLSHMPSHLDILIGDYRRAMAANAEALRADAKFVARRGDTGFYSVYRMHNYHSLIYAAMFAGQFKVAIAATDEMEAAITEDQLRIQSPPMADWLEVFCAVRPHVFIRFGRWQDIKDLPLPLDRDLYCVTTATLHYAKGVAWAATGDVARSAEERELFLAAKARVPETRMDYPNRCVDILAVAEAMLDGELEYRRGDDVEAAFALLRRAVELDDGLVYSEPWPWMQPARHALAALLLEQGRVGEAAEVYRADLGLNDTLFRARHHPNNIWALHGYHECAVRLGLHGEARIIQQQLKTALAFADVPIVSSCYCRRGEIQDGSGSQVNGVDKCH